MTNLGDAVNGWTLTWTFPSGQTIAQAWNAAATQSGSQVTAKNVGHNGTIATNASVSFGFTGSASGSNTSPTSFSLNGVACTGSGSNPPPSNTTPPTNPPTTTPPTTTPPSQSSTAFKGVGNSACGDLPRLKTTWWYNWYIDPGSCKTGEFIPMVSGKDKHGAGDIAWQRDQAINAGYKTILGFNEPDHTDQANMSVDTAVALWPTLTATAAEKGIRIGGPAPSGDSGGRTWLNDFMRQVESKKLKVDFLTLHWYGWGSGACTADASGLERQIEWMEGFPGNRPIWVTEFGCLNLPKGDPANIDRVHNFYRGALAVFARHPRVERYAWYPWDEPGNELVRDGNLTAIGNTFANAPGTRNGGGSTGGDVTIVNRATGKCLDLVNGSTAENANVQQWSCNGGTNQRWRIENLGDGTNRITNVASGKALDAANCGTADGTNIQQFTWWNNNCQRWQTVDTGGGWFRLLNPNSGKVADVADCKSADGTNVRLWSWLGNDCQQWQAR